jgi:large subunit ribosomal protein L15
VKLHDLQPASGSHKPSRRVGRGHGSGRGKTAGRGTKGQKSRAGSGIPAWFEGGQTPLHVRTPKLHGFKNRFRVAYAGVNLARLTDVAAGTLITPDVLRHDGLLRTSKTKLQPLKILGGGDAPKGVTIHAHAFTRSALDKLQAAGSTAQRISWPDGLPIDEEADAAEIAAANAANQAKADARAAGKAKAKRAKSGAAAPVAAASAESAQAEASADAAAEPVAEAEAAEAEEAPADEPSEATDTEDES